MAPVDELLETEDFLTAERKEQASQAKSKEGSPVKSDFSSASTKGKSSPMTKKSPADADDDDDADSESGKISPARDSKPRSSLKPDSEKMAEVRLPVYSS